MTPSLALDTTLSPKSRVWIYTTNRPLTEAEVEFVQPRLDAFVHSWTAHNQALLAKGELFERQYLVLAVDESQAGASGCSIDKSVHFLEQLGQHLRVDFFERMRFGWQDTEGQLHMADRTEFAALLQDGTITNDTPVVNTLVKNRQDLAENWLLPYGRSWHRRLF